jgi:hypothetical protein
LSREMYSAATTFTLPKVYFTLSCHRGAGDRRGPVKLT